MAYCSALSLNFFLYYMYHHSIHLPFNLCIKDTDFDTLPKQGHTNRYMYVCLLINFWKQCCGFIVIINRFLLQMVHFLSHIELKWKFGLRVYFFIHVSVAQRHIFPMGKIGQRTRNKKKEKILLLKCHLSPFMIVCMGSMSIQEMALLP